MANIAPNMMSVGMSCEPPMPPPGEGAMAQATWGKNRFIGQSAYPIARQNIAREKRAPEGVERSCGDCLAHCRHQTQIEPHIVQGEQPVGQQLFGDEQMTQVPAREGAARVAV